MLVILYDTKEGIASQLTSLEGLIQVLEARGEATHNDETKRLQEFVVLGHTRLDQFGQVWQAKRPISKEEYPDLSNVMTYDEFKEFLSRHERLKDSFIWIMGGHSGCIPSNHLLCAECNVGWTIENCHDTYCTHKFAQKPLAEFGGKTLREVKAHFKSQTDAIYVFLSEHPIRNDRFIDLTPHEQFPNLVKNEHGWAGRDAGITDDYVVQDGDEGHFDVWHFYHKACNRTLKERNAREFCLDVFAKAGFDPNCIAISPVVNQYCPAREVGQLSGDCCAPWFDFVTPFGIIMVGARKRFYNLDWQPTGCSFPRLFSDEDVTQGDTFVHAWTQEKLIEYLERLRHALALEPR